MWHPAAQVEAVWRAPFLSERVAVAFRRPTTARIFISPNCAIKWTCDFATERIAGTILRCSISATSAKQAILRSASVKQTGGRRQSFARLSMTLGIGGGIVERLTAERSAINWGYILAATPSPKPARIPWEPGAIGSPRN